MARAPSHITRRGSKYIYRRRVPGDVRGAPFFGGKEHYQTSLATSDLNEAKRRGLIVGLRFDAEVEAARSLLLKKIPLEAGRDYVLTESALDAMKAEWWADEIGRAKSNRRQAEAEPDGEWAAELARREDSLIFDMAKQNDPTTAVEARRALKAEVRKEVAPFAKARALRLGIELGSDDYRRIEGALAEAHMDTLRGRFAAALELDVEPANEGVKRGLGRTELSQSSWTFRQLAKHVLQQQPKGESWKGKVDQVVLSFEAYLDRPKAISEVTAGDISGYIDLLLRTPERASMRFPGYSLRQAVAANRALAKPHRTISPNTIRDTHFAVLRSIFAYAARMQWVSPSPADRIKVPGSTKKGGTKPSFKQEELNELFRLPVFTGCRSEAQAGVPGTVKLNDHRFWTPLIMLFSGARPSEIGQLAVSDVKLNGRIPYISILTEFDPDDPEDFVVSFKTANARRELPIHPKLLELGFDDFVGQRVREGGERLFPDWKLSGNPRKLYSGASWINRFNNAYIPKITNRHPRPTFYSLRHTFKVAMVRHKIDRAAQSQILGHAQVGMDGSYFDGLSLEELHSQISEIIYKDIALDHLCRKRV
jgi:integrase